MEDNGILGKVPGQSIAAAFHKLPPPEAAGPDQASADVEVPWLGLIRIGFVKFKVRHYKHAHWSWLVVRADLVEADASAPPGENGST